MSTSELRRVLAVSAVGGACLALVANPADPVMSSLPIHPIWAIALILAARYGVRGLLSLPVLTGSLVVADWVIGGSGAAALARTGRGGDLAMWLVAVGVAVIGGAQERRKAVLRGRLDAAEERARVAEVAADQLCEAALVLRDRCDHSETSLAFFTDVAARMDDLNPTSAGQAALEFAMARTGAGAGLVQLFDGAGRLRTLTARGRWGADAFAPPVLFRDLTATAALEYARAVAAHEVPGVRPDDSDLAAPLIDVNGRQIGVLSLRRVPYDRLGGAVRENLTAIARWATGSLARLVVDSGPPPDKARPGVDTRYVGT